MCGLDIEQDDKESGFWAH